MKQRVFLYCGLFILGLLLLNLMVAANLEMRQAGDRLAATQVYWAQIKLGLWGVLLGILIEWPRLKNILTGKLHVNRALLVPAVILLVLALIPTMLYYIWFGVGEIYGIGATRWLLDPLRQTATHSALSIMAGILLVRSLGAWK